MLGKGLGCGLYQNQGRGWVCLQQAPILGRGRRQGAHPKGIVVHSK